MTTQTFAPETPATGPPDDALSMAQAQLVLAEKRTSLASIRTGIAIFALPLTIISALIATSKLYDAQQVLHLLVPVVVVCGGLLVLAVYLTTRAVFRIRRYDRILERIRAQSPRLAEVLR